MIKIAKTTLRKSLAQLPLKNKHHFSNYLKQSDNYDIANQLRIDAINAIHVTKSGHPSSCASIAQILSVLFFHKAGLRFHAGDVNNFTNDRLVLSKGHAAPILYSALYRSNVVTYQNLMTLRLKHSLFQGHPTPRVPFVDVATGSLGQGLSAAAGMAYSSKYFDRIGNRVYCITGDGQLAEGNIWEAADFANNYQLNNLTLLVDANRLGQSQPSMHQHNVETIAKKFLAFGWASRIINGHQISEIVKSLEQAKLQKSKPTAIICKTIKGKNLTEEIENKVDWHGKDLGTKISTVNQFLQGLIKNKNVEFVTYLPQQKSAQLISDSKPVTIKPNYQKNVKVSTRKAYGNGLAKARQSNQNVVALDADTKNSTFSITLKQKYPNSFIECFIAEQNMVGVALGLSCRKKIPFCSSFGAFLMRAVDQIRIAGIGRNAIKVVGSHSGCSIGEDGPSQMALEDLGIFRNIPNCLVLVPSDAVSTQKAVELAANYNSGPSYIRTSRPEVPILYNNQEKFQIGKSKVIHQSQNDKLLVISYGVTLHECIKAHNNLQNENISVRIIDLFCLNPIDVQTLKQNIEACNGKILVVEQHYKAGAAYEAVCGLAAEYIKHIHHLYVKETPGSATPAQQLQIQQLDAESIQKYIIEMLG